MSNDVRRGNILGDALREARKARFDPIKLLKVSFVYDKVHFHSWLCLV